MAGQLLATMKRFRGLDGQALVGHALSQALATVRGEAAEKPIIPPPTGDDAPAPHSREAHLEEFFRNEVEPFWRTGQEGRFPGVHGVDVVYRLFSRPRPKAHVVIIQGYCESMTRYRELAHDLFAQGYAVHLYDHRGQGFSGRLIPDRRLVHCDNFAHLVADLKTFVVDHVPRAPEEKLFALAHSMGGAVTAWLLAEEGQPFDAAVLSAPMMALDTAPFPDWLARRLLRSISAVGLAQKAMVAPRSPDRWEMTDTSSVARYEHYRQNVLAGGRYQDGMSFGFVANALGAARHVTGRRQARRVTVPVLLAQGGRDSWVAALGHRRFARHAPRCQLWHVPEAQHSMYMERDVIRERFLRRVFSFYDTKLTGDEA
jgi:lysophospholipase